MTKLLSVLGEAASEGRIFGLDQQMFISVAIQLFNACVLSGALAFVLYKPLSQFLRTRSQLIKDQLAQAGENKAEAEKLRQAYEKKLAGIETERQRILDEAEEQAIINSEQLLADTEKEVVAIKKEAFAEIEIEKRNAKDEMRQEIIEIAALMAEKIIRKTVDEKMQNHLFEEAVSELEELL